MSWALRSLGRSAHGRTIIARLRCGMGSRERMARPKGFEPLTPRFVVCVCRLPAFALSCCFYKEVRKSCFSYILAGTPVFPYTVLAMWRREPPAEEAAGAVDARRRCLEGPPGKANRVLRPMAV